MPVLSLSSLPAVRVPRRYIKRFVWTVVPGVLVLGVLARAMSGDEGLLERHLVKQRVLSVLAEVEQVEAENATLRAEVEALKSDRQAVIRAASEELMLAPAGSTIYRFE